MRKPCAPILVTLCHRGTEFREVREQRSTECIFADNRGSDFIRMPAVSGQQNLRPWRASHDTIRELFELLADLGRRTIELFGDSPLLVAR